MGESPLRQRLANDGLWPVRLPWVISQRWGHLLYLHYRVAPDQLRGLLPAPLELDEFEGSAFVSVIPLHMEHVHLRDLFAVPGTANFAEVNVRTYVVHNGVPGVYFLSIDAASRFASFVARSTFHLPYSRASMTFEHSDGSYEMRSTRAGATPVTFEATYRPTGRTVEQPPGSETRFLAERYCMYVIGRSGRLLRGDISHLPWTITTVEASITRNDLLAANGVTPLEEQPIAAYSEGSDARCWPVRSAAVPQRVWPRI